MIVNEREADVKRMADQLFAEEPDWVTFYREVLGPRGIVRHTFPTREMCGIRADRGPSGNPANARQVRDKARRPRRPSPPG